MKAQIPKELLYEQERLIKLYMSMPDGTDWDEFFRKNASKRFLRYYEQKQARKKKLREQGIIEN